MKKKAPHWFKAWRKGLKLTQKEAAFLLGLKSRMVQNYEKGSHDIPLYIRLAMAALSNGIIDFEDNEFRHGDKALALIAAKGLAASKDATAEKRTRKKQTNKAKKAKSSKTEATRTAEVSTVESTIDSAQG
ncbi:MAG: XRE family transcriptional regulator [Alphaproteobacteria bacterium TMED89]|nr:MAG: XRE family transcriptional regulator [Alphaproteobacteria bacterium TMED89]